MQNILHTALDSLRDRFAPLNHTSNFRTTGQLTPEEFLLAGDFLVYKFPSWSWADAATPSKRVDYFPPGKQYLVTRGVPCHKRIKNDDFAGAADGEDQLVRDMLAGEAGGEDEGWLKPAGKGDRGGMSSSAEMRRDVRTVDEAGNVGEEGEGEEDEIPDMEDEDDGEAIIRDVAPKKGEDGLRSYTLYITYTPYYRTPRLYLSGYDAATNKPLPPLSMMEDIVGDYKDKTVTLEDFPFSNPPIKTASVHPCKHASVMKVLLDRADAALKIRLNKASKNGEKPSTQGLEGLVDQTSNLDINKAAASSPSKTGSDNGKGGDADWEVLDSDSQQEQESAIRVDQYLVVFLKFMASVTPGIEHDFTMSL
ncbi:hypothetical protein MBLNU230_g8079t1 [Neophaeotheca triangularis]